ncbi:MAG: hypothetical protein ACE5HI_15350 [bacterium]
MEKLLDIIVPLITFGLGSWITWIIARKNLESKREVAQASLATQLRLAALEQRLEIHQSTYTLCRRLIRNFNKNELWKIVSECERFWDENCLYLGAKSKETFFNAFKAAMLVPGLTNQTEEERKTKKEIWKELWIAIKALEEETGLPPISSEDYPPKEPKQI